MKDFKYIWLVGLIVTAIIVIVPIVTLVTRDPAPNDDPQAHLPDRTVPDIDHSPLLQGPYESGSDVTRACLECHPESGEQMLHNVHWKWEGDPVRVPGYQEPVTIGKKNQLNNFCVGIQGNWTGCTRCHAGYGWEDASFDFSNQENIDCLVCHEQTGTYVKSNAGRPDSAVDLAAVAQSVGTPTRANCGGCHFNGGGGNSVKHGDLSSVLYYPTENLDVHMGRLGFQCIDCHQTEDHNIKGRAMSVSVENENQVFCTDCHSETLHDDERINAHVASVACQTCHIPAGATRDATKMIWDWSTAGQDLPEDPHEYLKIKGSFVYEQNFTPTYAWANGHSDRYILGETIDPDQAVLINQPLGGIDDRNAKIWPFKIHQAKQIYDPVYNILLQPKTVGEGGYWTEFDWDLAARLGAEAAGLPYSGQYDFTETVMYWPLSHEVQPAEYALQCSDCHGDNSRMDWETLGYYGDPIRWGGRNIDIISMWER